MEISTVWKAVRSRVHLISIVLISHFVCNPCGTQLLIAQAAITDVGLWIRREFRLDFDKNYFKDGVSITAMILFLFWAQVHSLVSPHHATAIALWMIVIAAVRHNQWIAFGYVAEWNKLTDLPYHAWRPQFVFRIVFNPRRNLTFVSHPWYHREDPDPRDFIKHYIRSFPAHLRTPYLWYDEMSIIQDESYHAAVRRKWGIASQRRLRSTSRLLTSVERTFEPMLPALYMSTMTFLPRACRFLRFTRDIEYHQRYLQHTDFNGVDPIPANRFWLWYENYQSDARSFPIKFRFNSQAVTAQGIPIPLQARLTECHVFGIDPATHQPVRLECPPGKHKARDEDYIASAVVNREKPTSIDAMYELFNLLAFGWRSTLIPGILCVISAAARKYLGISVLCATRTHSVLSFIIAAFLKLRVTLFKKNQTFYVYNAVALSSLTLFGWFFEEFSSEEREFPVFYLFSCLMYDAL